MPKIKARKNVDENFKVAAVQGVLPTVVSPGAIWAQVEPGLESEALLANCALS